MNINDLSLDELELLQNGLWCLLDVWQSRNDEQEQGIIELKDRLTKAIEAAQSASKT